MFCGANKRSIEHCWPQWIRQSIPTLFHDPESEISHWRGPVGQEERVARSGDIQVTSRCVCGDCNNGWMSDLEDLSKPLLIAMMAGKKRTLFLVSQRIVAAWIAKTGLMQREAIVDRSHPSYTAFPSSHREHLFRHGEATPQSQIWIAHYRDSDYRLFFREISTHFPIKDDRGNEYGRAFVYGHLMLVGNLVLFLVGWWSDNPGWSYRMEPTHQAEDLMIPIWPPPLIPTVKWPPNAGMTTNDFHNISESFGNGITDMEPVEFR